jgi:hypothetical protein
MENQKPKIHAIDEILGDLAVYENPNLLFEQYSEQIDTSGINKIALTKYGGLLSNIRYAWQKTLKYKKYFEDFYPPIAKVENFEALNHHIHAYLQDMDILKNKIEVFLGEAKHDIKKIATNKKEIEEFFQAGVEKTKKVFAGISKHRNPHTHKGMRFFDGDLLKAENAHHTKEILKNPVFDGALNPQAKPEFIAKLDTQKEESFNAAKKRWIGIAIKNDAQTSGYLDGLLNGVRPSLYKFLEIEPITEILGLQTKNR